MSDAPLLPGLSSAEARRIDQTCDRFEAAWKAGPRPLLEEYLDAADEPERSALLRQLLLLDWDFRRRAGDRPAGGDYLARFPGDQALIDAVGREMSVHADDTPWPAGLEGALPQAAFSGSARYELLQEVGHGGAGVVFRGRDRLLGRELAVKVLRDVYRRAPEFYRRFVEEARVGSRLQHPAIVPVYELGWFDDRRPYITMKLVEGRTLAALLKERGDPASDWPRLLGVFEQVCQAMAYAHAQGVVHRDLKPTNIMVGAFGEVQVMDWGFAKVLGGQGQPREGSAAAPAGGETGASRGGVMMGTPAYMPPEQARGEADRIGPRADVFALGAILCEILTGGPPYVGAFPDVCLMAAQGELADACKRLDACGADASLRELARRCLAPDRDVRPADAGVVARDVAAYLASAQEQVRQAQLERAAAEARALEARAKMKAERRVRRLTVALAAPAAVLAAAAGFGWLQYDRFKQAQAARTAAVDGKIEAALAEADERLNRNDRSGAAAAGTRARELRASEASGRWDARMNETLADVELVTRLDDAHLLQTEFDAATRSFHREKAMPQFAEAFARYGIHVGCDPAEAAARLAGRPAAVRRAAAGALENWWLLALKRDAAARDWLWAMLQAVDADEWRARLRRAVADSDRRGLKELATEDDALRQPADSLAALANALEHFQDHDAVIALLRPAQRLHPDDFWINLELAQALNRRRPSDSAEALRFVSAAWALRPANVDYVYLAWSLTRQQDWDGVVFASRKAIDLHPDNGQAYNQLGVGLEKKGQWEQAEAAYRKAVELQPDGAVQQCNLGKLLDRRGQKDEAAAAFECAARLAPEDAENRFNLGQFHWRRKEFNAALKEYDKAIALDPAFVKAHASRGDALAELGRLDDAIAAYQTAIRLNPTDDKLFSSLGITWKDKGDFERAVAACSRAVELNPRSAANQSNLGLALYRAEDHGGAIAVFREAIRLDADNAHAHCNLGLALQGQGLFAEALAEIERGHQLGSGRTDWHYASAQWLEQARRLVELDAKLPSILDGSEKPASPGEQLGYAKVCQVKGLYGASARLYANAFTAEPALAPSEVAVYRYRAACVAAQAGCGQGHDAPQLDAAERSRWRKQALDWLRADLALWADAPDRSPGNRSAAASELRLWRSERALAGIREPEELAKLPAPERADFIRFWADVQDLLARRLSNTPGE